MKTLLKALCVSAVMSTSALAQSTVTAPVPEIGNYVEGASLNGQITNIYFENQRYTATYSWGGNFIYLTATPNPLGLNVLFSNGKEVAKARVDNVFNFFGNTADNGLTLTVFNMLDPNNSMHERAFVYVGTNGNNQHTFREVRDDIVENFCNLNGAAFTSTFKLELGCPYRLAPPKRG